MSLLGFNAFGRLALGQIGQSSAVAQALTARSFSAGKLRTSVTAQSAVQGHASGSARANVGAAFKGVIVGLASAKTSIRGPAGFSVGGRVGTAAKMRVPGGFLIFGSIKSQTEATALPHLEIKTTPARRALLLNSASATASYWKGHS